MEAARAAAALDAPGPDGTTRREALLQVEKASGHRPSGLDTPRPPEGTEYLLALFAEIRAGASDGFSGARITWRDLLAYRDLTGVALDAFEIEALYALDEAVRAAQEEARRPPVGRPDQSSS